jgi:predicted metal-dependent peptidase
MNRSDAKDKAAYDKIIRARTALVISQPFFGALALHLELVEEKGGKGGPNETMWVNGTHMGYYPAFVHKINERELEGVIAHETMHCCYKHMTRKQHRNHVIFNWAGDYIINSDLKKAGFTLPTPHLYDAKYDGMSTEEVYEKLKQEVEQQLKKQPQQKGSSKGQKGNAQGGVIILPDTDLNVPDRDCCGEVRDVDGNKVDQGKVEREWDATVRMAANVAKRANAGNTPGYLERLVKATAEPRVSWRELTRQFIDNSMSKDYSWSRPNRRMISRDLYLPGFVSDALQHAVFVIDASGSITVEMGTQMLGEVGGSLNDGIADKLTVIYHDTEVYHIDEYVPGDVIKLGNLRGGGTDFADVYKYISEHAPDAQCVIHLTDMLTATWGQDPGMPVLWGAFLPDAMLATIRPPFGSVVKVDTSE